MLRLLTYGLVLIVSVADAQQEKTGLVVIDCNVSSISDPTLYASKPGRLTVAPEEGDVVANGDILARIDDTEALLSLKAAIIEENVAKKQAENNVDILYAEAQEKVTEAEYQEAIDTNRRAPGAISESETRRRKFQHKRSGLATEQARRDHIIALESVKLASAKVQVARHEWETRRVKSEIDGVVSQRFAQVGEWVNAGDPIAKLVRLDQIRVIGYVNVHEVARNAVFGKDAVVELKLVGDEVKRIPTQISYVGFDVGGDDTYKVWADIPNTREGDRFVIHPGSEATMMIDVAGIGRRDSFVPSPAP